MGFMDFVVTPMFEAVAMAIPTADKQLETLAINRKWWEERVDVMQAELEKENPQQKVWVPKVGDTTIRLPVPFVAAKMAAKAAKAKAKTAAAAEAEADAKA